MSAVPVQAADPIPDGFTVQNITDVLNQPVAFGFTPTGQLYVAEKRGTVQVFDSVADPSPTEVIDIQDQVHDYWDRGLLGFAVDPEFGSGSDFLYLLYTLDVGNSWDDGCMYPTSPPQPPFSDENPEDPAGAAGCVVNGQLSRFQMSGGVTPGPEQVLLTGKWCAQFPSHTIGDLAFTEDDDLLVSAGDGASFNYADHGQTPARSSYPLGPLNTNPCADPMGVPGHADDEGGALRSQDLRTPNDPVNWDGTLLRVNKATGAAASGNPVSPDNRIIASGLRNPFRIAARPGTNEVWVGDVGWGAWEEINRVVDPGGAIENFGWPCYEGNDTGSARHSTYDALDLNICESLYAEGSSGVVAPHYARPHEQVNPPEGCAGSGGAVSGLAFYDGGRYPDSYDGALFMADYSFGCIRVMVPDTPFGVPNKANISTLIGGVTAVDLQIGPEGDLYYADIVSGRIVRVRFNSEPVAVIEADFESGGVPLQVSFDGTGSSDGEGDALTYAWDLDGDGQYDDSTASQPTWEYNVPNVAVTVSLRVTDPFSLSAFDSIQINPVDHHADITSPLAAQTWQVGDTIEFSGGAIDAVSGEMPASALSWEIAINHCEVGGDCHKHVIRTFDGFASETFTAPDHLYPSYLSIRLIATDPDGFTDIDQVDIHPQTSVVGITSNPPGRTVLAGVEGLDPFTAPVQITGIIGSSLTVDVPSPQVSGGFTYTFATWSDGGAQTHTITIPAADSSLTADFTISGGGGGGGGGGSGGGGSAEQFFDDVPVGHAFYAAINWLALQRITLGCTSETFCPGDPVTRGEMAAFLARAQALLPAPSGRFVDTAGSPYEWAISSLVAAGITQGCAVDRYCPDAPVTREQMASFLVRAFSFAAGPDIFTDDENSVHEEDINALARARITLGCTATTFCPNDVVTREQMAAFLFRAFNP
ncbi:MAG: PQQ-dependent sugar dehydrogenase [Acidimicrobiia bacterium]